MKAFQCVSYHRTNAAKVKLMHHEVKAETNPGVCVLGITGFFKVLFEVRRLKRQKEVELFQEAPRPPNSVLSINSALSPMGTRFPLQLGVRVWGV